MDTNKTDEQVQKDVLAELAWEPRVGPTELVAGVNNGVVILTGSVDSYLKRWAAEEAAHRVRGVKTVANELQVKLPVASQRDDSEISAAAIRALESNSLLHADHLAVTVADAWITLKGEVQWNFEREEAERAVRSLWGVKGVTTLIAVKPRATPDQLKREIEKALVRNAEADAQKITVDVQGSKVILKGHVRAWVERLEAERVAWMAPGVTQVEDQIQVA